MPELTPEILWEDGMLLRPQHMQALQDHCRGLISQVAIGRPFAYGVRKLKIREASVGNWVFEVTSCELVMPDGTVVVSGETARLRPVEFSHLKLDAPTLDVWIAIPLPKDEEPNVARTGDGEAESRARRYVESARTRRDENTGEDAREYPVKLLNAEIYVGVRPPSGHVSMKIAELRKVITEGEEGRRYELSQGFVPPSLSINASPALHAVVQDLLDRLEEKNAELLSHLHGRRSLLTGESSERPETLIKLQATNGVLPLLRQLAGQPEMHPFDVYLHLCRLAGDLAIFSDTWEPPKLVLFDHDDSLRAFVDLKSKWLTLLEKAVDTTVERTPFVVSDTIPGAIETTIPPKYFEPTVGLYIGVATESSIGEVAGRFSNGKTIVTAPDDLMAIRRARIDGIPCQPDDEPHPGLRDRDNLVVLKIERAGELWSAAEKSKRLAMAGEAVDAGDAKFFLYATNVKH